MLAQWPHLRPSRHRRRGRTFVATRHLPPPTEVHLLPQGCAHVHSSVKVRLFLVSTDCYGQETRNLLKLVPQIQDAAPSRAREGAVLTNNLEDRTHVT